MHTIPRFRCVRFAALAAVLPAMVSFCDSAARAATDAARVFQAGTARANVTPPLGLAVVGNFIQKPATYVHDELWVRCLVLDDGASKLAIAIIDNIGPCRVVGDAARKWIVEETGLPAANILIAGTHTHSAASARSANRMATEGPLSEYQQFIARRVADGVRCAVNNLQPARIGFGSADLPKWAHNRRWLMAPGDHLKNPFGGMDRARMNPPTAHEALIEPAGPVDPQISFISLQTPEGRPLALLANYGMHYVGGVPADHYSADYFGVFSERIGDLLGAEKSDPAFLGILANGASGDVTSTDRSRKTESFPPYGKIRTVAEDAAQAVLAAHKAVTFHDWVPLSAAMDEVVLSVRKPSDEMVAHARAVLEKAGDAPVYHTHERNYAGRIIRQIDAPDEVFVPLQVLRVGPLAITGIPFEVFSEIGLELKAKSPSQPTFTISFANGSYAYLPTPRHFEIGGYETWLGTNLVEPQASVKIVDRLLAMLDGLKKQAGE